VPVKFATFFRLYTCNVSITGEWIFMKVGMEVMPLEASSNLVFFPAVSNTNIIDAKIC
jgi:hypothetical protein